MKRQIFCIIVLFSLILFSFLGCASKNSDPYTDTYLFAMDTVITLRLPASVGDDIRTRCAARITELEQLLSRTVPTSEITAFNKMAAGSYLFSEDTAAVIAAAILVAQSTNGAYDPTVASLSQLWNITGTSPTVPKTNAIQNCLKTVGYEHLTLEQNTLTKDMDSIMLDLGGCAKGYACAACVELLQENGVENGIVSFGGNIGVIGQKPDGSPWRIGIKDPAAPESIAGYVLIEEGYVSVSGDYERYFEADGVRYHHIFDRNTGFPADSGVRSVAVYAKDAAKADALSTALFVMGAKEGIAFYRDMIKSQNTAVSFEAIWYLSDGTTVITDGIREQYEHSSVHFSAPD